jgi:hypothetical protein
MGSCEVPSARPVAEPNPTLHLTARHVGFPKFLALRAGPPPPWETRPIASDDTKPGRLTDLQVHLLVALFLAPTLAHLYGWRVGALAFVPPVLLGAVVLLTRGRRKPAEASMHPFRYRLIDTAGGEKTPAGVIENRPPDSTLASVFDDPQVISYA